MQTKEAKAKTQTYTVHGYVELRMRLAHQEIALKELRRSIQEYQAHLSEEELILVEEAIGWKV